MKGYLKFSAFLLAGCLALSAAGCAGGGAAQPASSGASAQTSSAGDSAKPGARTKLVWWGGVPEDAGPTDVVEAYNKLQDQVELEYVRFVNDTQGNTKLDTALMSGEGVDLFTTYGNAVLPARVHNGTAADLSEFFKKYDYDYESDVGDIAKGTYVDGKPYSVVSVKSIKVFVLNKNMFDEAGIPLPTDWTLDDMREIAKKLTKGSGDSKVWGVSYHTADWDYWIRHPRTLLGGNAQWKDDGTSNFDHPSFKKSLQTIYDMQHVDGSMPLHSEWVTKNLTIETQFLSGKSAMVTPSFVYRYIIDTEKYPHDFVTAFAPIPKISADQKDYYAPDGIADNIGIAARSSNKDEAFKFMMWYQTDGVLYLSAHGRIPASSRIDISKVAETVLGKNADLFDRQSFQDYYLGAKFNKYTITTETRASNEMSKIVAEETEKALIDSISVDQALDNMKKRSDAELAKSK